MTYEKLDRYIEHLIRDSSPEEPLWDIEKIRFRKPPSWNYINGCMITAFLELYKVTGQREFLEFSDRFIDAFISEDGMIRGFRAEKHELDDITEGRVLFDLYPATGKEKYRLAIEFLKERLDLQPRTEGGNYWHKLIYPNQVWLDGIYMAQVFRARYEETSGERDYGDILAQLREVRAHMYCPEKGLFFHGWDASRSVFWADPVTGCSANFWLRAMGWFLCALADIAGYCTVPEAREEVGSLLREAVGGIARYRDEATGMYWQVIDCPDAEGNYLESSGSAMVAYAMMKGARLGILEQKYAALGHGTFDGICQKYLKISDSGELHLGGICLMAGLGPETRPERDGSLRYYLSEPVVENEGKGVAPLIMAYSEVRRLS